MILDRVSSGQNVPTDVNVVIEIQHRFYGPVNEDAGGTVLGMTRGANVGLGFR